VANALVSFCAELSAAIAVGALPTLPSARSVVPVAASATTSRKWLAPHGAYHLTLVVMPLSARRCGAPCHALTPGVWRVIEKISRLPPPRADAKYRVLSSSESRGVSSLCALLNASATGAVHGDAGARLDDATAGGAEQGGGDHQATECVLHGDPP
jgi:hypothetical protein